MLLMQVNPLRGQVGECWPWKFLGPQWYLPFGLIPFYRAQKSLDFHGPTPSHFPKKWIACIKSICTETCQSEVNRQFYVHEFLYSVFCILHSVFCILYSLFCILYSVFCILYSVFCDLCSAFCILYSLFCILVPRRLFVTALQWLAIAQGPKIS